jgi:cysteine-rich repeat protein
MRLRDHATSSLFLAGTAAGLGFLAAGPFMGCSGGDAVNVSTGTTGTTGGTGGAGTGGSGTGAQGGGGSGGSGGHTCGNSVVESGEDCDDGNLVAGDGCESDCTFTCTQGDAKCDDKDPCDGMESCSAQHVCQKGTNLADGSSCGTGKICKVGVCSDTVCGDGFVSGTEQCDDGNTVAGDGCESDCTFSCLPTNPAACTPADPCQGKGTCDATKHTCTPGTPLANGTVCGAGSTCQAGVCKPNACGNGTIDPGEQCDPPNTPTCDATCHTIVTAVCGNGVREGAEQCDDGNTTNLDGCDSACKFEQDQRVNYLKMQWATDAVCTANALGGAVATVAQGTLQTSIDGGIADGSISVMFKYLGLDDLTGTSDPAVSLGPLNGTPVMMGPATYNGTNDLDWWYTVDPLSIDANRNPLSSLAGSITAKLLKAGPGNLSLTLLLAGVPAPLNMSGATVTVSIGAAGAPLASAGNPPGHLAAEHLDPALVSFNTSGLPTATGAGELCGNVSAASLAKVPVPAALAAGGSTACSQGYTVANNSLLDVFVGGCTVFIIQAIKATQPDKTDPGAPVAGAGGPYKLSANAQHQVTTCKDKNNATVTLSTCLSAAAYSSFFKFTTDRVIIK